MNSEDTCSSNGRVPASWCRSETCRSCLLCISTVLKHIITVLALDTRGIQILSARCIEDCDKVMVYPVFLLITKVC